jgi:hypothetical protein
MQEHVSGHDAPLPCSLSAEEVEERFAITDSTGQVLAYVYFEPDPNNDSRRRIMNRLTHDEARRIASNIARLPALLKADTNRNANDEQKN